ncbi:succinylglutamate desuccinylase/aspartoacylase family protein [Pseudoroseicyclus tamaricis]|uniref:Succinylglutamate desuccinylase/Aspartoacylase catalytic domain-containing protein n=1 Tax=Pseudoroseicyclus tamaricis TaxID=2705421 RepID=A0A6B2JNJ8_9RHOB|nr:succinylglutamate desuccinylase/aspartoacylase family protein [Pseudoroseicyclus tamaricis]NDV00267.1 hypothetical protein [Pseudoroseicyclus tamaricis]
MLTDLTKPTTRIARAEHAVPGSARPLTVITVTGGRPGPTLAVIGAVHGDELEGPLAIGQLLAHLDSEPIDGTLILLPVANPEAVAAGQRCTPGDGMNLARVFPGRRDGSVTEAMAAVITETVIAPADALVDLHSAAVAAESPLLAGYVATPGPVGRAAEGMARAFGAPVLWRHESPCPPGRTISVAEARGAPAIYVEATGGVTPPDELVDAYAEGVLRVMAHLGMIAPIFSPAPLPLCLAGDGDTDAPTVAAPHAGLLERHVELGAPVAAGQLCFTLRDVGGAVLAEIRAGSGGHPVFLRRSRWVERGELLMKLAEV